MNVLREAQQRLLQALQKVGDSGDLETTLLAEKLILKNERDHYADTSIMESSLDNALGDIEATLKLADTVRDPGAYKAIADGHTRPRNRIGGLPKDEARQFFKSHRSRLENLDKARLMGLDKALIAVRKKNLDVVSTAYIELQHNALAEPAPATEADNNFDGPR